MTTDLRLVNEHDPRAVVQRGTEQADAIMEVVKKVSRLAVQVGKNQYLRFEAWQTIARFNRASPVTEWTREILEGGKLAGFEARVQVVNIDTGTVISAAESMCGMDEFVTQGQSTEFAKRNAARSMAQTRAAAKALRMAYSFVAVLAGFEATPAEEMEHSRPSREEAPDPSNWCAEHGIAWFKRGKMRGFAHPIGDTGKWCRMPVEAPVPPAERPQDAEGQSTTTEAPGEAPRNLVQLWNAGIGLGYKGGKREILGVLGLTDDTQIADVGEAWEQLKVAKR